MTDALSSIQTRVAEINQKISGKAAKTNTEDNGAKMADILSQLAELNSASSDSKSSAIGIDDSSSSSTSTSLSSDTSSVLSNLMKAVAQQQAGSSEDNNAALQAKAALLYGKSIS